MIAGILVGLIAIIVLLVRERRHDIEPVGEFTDWAEWDWPGEFSDWDIDVADWRWPE